MKNDSLSIPFPMNLFAELETEPPQSTPDDFMATLMYVLRVLGSPRDAKAIMMRFQSGKNFDEIGEALGVSKQRAHMIIQDMLGTITGDQIMMLKKGLSQYMADMLNERIANLEGVLEASEREEIKKSAYEEGYKQGYADRESHKSPNTVNRDAIDNIRLITLQLSTRTFNACYRNNLKTIGDLLNLGDNIVDCKALGRTCFNELMEMLKGYNVNVNEHFPRALIRFGENDG